MGKFGMTSKTISTVGLMMAITLTGKLMGILRDSMQAMYFGTYSAEGIAFMQASILPRVFLDITFASVFSASFIPVFNKYLETQGKQAAFDLAARFIRLILLGTVCATIIAVIFSDPIYSIFLDGEALAADVRPLGVQLLRVMFPIIIISSMAFSLTGILQSLGQFYIPAAMSIASNGVILLYYFFFIDHFGVYGLAVAFLLGWACQVLIQIPFLRKHKFSIFAKGGGSLRDIGQLAIPVMVASWLSPVNFLVNTRASVNLYNGEHGFVAISFAHSLFTVITGVLVLSVSNVLFPTLSKFAANNNWEEYTAFLRSSLRGLLFLLIPMTFGLMAVAQPLVSLVFEGGRFHATSVEITATALFFFSMGIVGFGLQVIFSRACFALQDGKGPLVTAIIAMMVNLVLSFTLASEMEIAGPALASAIAVSVAAIGLFIRLAKKLPEPLWTKDMTIDAIKVLILAVAMYWLVTFLLVNTFMVLAIIVGAAIYFAGALIFGVIEAKITVKWIMGKIPRRQG